MAKALLGHVGVGPDARLSSELRRLRDRVRDLEHEVALLRAANAALSSERLVNDEMLSLELNEHREPAYS